MGHSMGGAIVDELIEVADVVHPRIRRDAWPGRARVTAEIHRPHREPGSRGAAREVIVVVGVIAQAVLDDQDALDLLIRGSRQPVSAPQLRPVVGDERTDLFAGRRGLGPQIQVRRVRARGDGEDGQGATLHRESMPDLPARSHGARTIRPSRRITR